MSERTPRERLAEWLPHFFILGILGLSLLLMIWVMQPLVSVLMMAAALSALSHPLTAGWLYVKLKVHLGQMQDRTLRQMSAFGAMAMILLAIIIPIVIALWTLTGSFSFSDDMALGLVNKNLAAIDRLLDKLNDQLKTLQDLVPALEIDPKWIKVYIKSTLGDLLNLQPALMAFFFKGTGSFVVQLLLCILAMVFFFAEGSVVSRAVLNYTPLNGEEIDRLLNSFRQVILRLLVDTLGVALLKGVLLGSIVGYCIGVPPIFLILLASFICLLPLVGTTLIWLPSASLLYNRGDWPMAIVLVILCQLAIFGANWWMKRIGKKLHEHSATTSFFIFLSVIGGLVSFGVKGIVLGPMAVILVMVIGGYWRDYYHRNINGEESKGSESPDLSPSPKAPI